MLWAPPCWAVGGCGCVPPSLRRSLLDPLPSQDQPRPQPGQLHPLVGFPEPALLWAELFRVYLSPPRQPRGFRALNKRAILPGGEFTIPKELGGDVRSEKWRHQRAASFRATREMPVQRQSVAQRRGKERGREHTVGPSGPPASAALCSAPLPDRCEFPRCPGLLFLTCKMGRVPDEL